MENKPKYKILIIEDGQLNQKILLDTLRDTYTVHAVERGAEALKTARKFRPHLILLDIILPDINGFDLLRELKETNDLHHIPVIIITELNNDIDEEKGLRLGAVDYIRKPFNRMLVKARVNTHIQIVAQLLTIEKLSFFDALTGLPNRRKFDYHMEYEWHRAIRKQTRIGLMMMDLDHFKNYNDTFGHTQGDAMLKAVAKVLNVTLGRSTDTPCRWGGEEFAVLIPETTAESLLLMAEKIRVGIEEIAVPNIHNGEATKMTVSLGVVSTVPQKDEPLSAFIEKADRYLYRAKKAGRNRVQA